MKYAFLILFVFLSAIGFGQVRDVISTGDIVLYDFGNTTYEHTATRDFAILSKSGVVKGDRLFKVPATAPVDTIATLLAQMNANDILAFERGGEWRTSVTIPTDSISICAYGTGAKPIINAADLLTGWTALTSSPDTTIGAELVVNGDFENGATGWYGGTVASGQMTIDGGSSIWQASIFTTGKQYQYSIDVITLTTNIEIKYYDGTYVTAATITSTGTHIGTFTVPLTTNNRLYIYGLNSVIDNVSIKEMTITGGTGLNVYQSDCPVITNTAGIPSNYVCVVNDSLYSQVASLDSVNSVGKYYVDATPTPDVIYVYHPTDINTSTVEVSARWGAILAREKSNISIANIEVRHGGHNGIFLMGDGTQTYGNSTIINCTAYRNRNYGIAFHYGYSNSTVSYCESSYNGNNFYSIADESTPGSGSNNNTFSYCTSSNGIHYIDGMFTDGHGFGIFGSDNCIVENSSSHSCNHNINAELHNQPYDVIIRNNHFYNSKFQSSGITVGNIAIGGTALVHNNLLTNNAIDGGGGSNFSVEMATAGDILFYNNTIYQDTFSTENDTYVIYLMYAQNVTLKNNIIFDLTNVSWRRLLTYDNGTPITDHNLWYSPERTDIIYDIATSTSYTFSEWQATGQSTNGVNSDPSFTDSSNGDFTLQSGSPAINAGTDVGLTQDINGNPISGLPDIGAVEFQP